MKRGLPWGIAGVSLLALGLWGVQVLLSPPAEVRTTVRELPRPDPVELSGEGPRGVPHPKDAGSTPTVPLVVRVLGPEGPVPAEGASVLLDGASVGQGDARGQLELAFPLDGRGHLLWAEAGAARSAPHLLREEALPAGPLTLILRATSALRGRVLDPSGAPVAGATVGLLPETDPPTRSGEDGVFSFVAQPPGRRGIVARSQGAASVRAEVDLITGRTQEVVLTLHPSARVAGIVIDAAGAPLPGLEVRGAGLVPELPARRILTDPEGRFELMARNLGWVSLRLEARGSLGVYEGPPRTDLKIRVEATGAVTVHARRPGGEPVRRAAFLLSSFDPLAQALRTVELLPQDPVDRPGEYRADGLLPGRWEISEAGTRQADRKKLASFTLAPGAELVVDLELPAGPVTIEGEVVDRITGAPLAGAQVELGRAPASNGLFRARHFARTTVSDADGIFTFEGVEAEDDTLRISRTGYRSEVERAGPEEEGVIRVSLLPGRELRGRVVDERGLPLRHFFVDSEAVDSPDGTFIQTVLALAEYVTFTAPGRATVVRELEVVPGSVDLGEVPLLPMPPVLLRVLDASGAPVEGARVRVRGGPEETTTFSPGTDGRGESRLVVTMGAYRLLTTHPRLGSSREEVSRLLEGGETVELTLSEAAWIFGSAGGPDRIVSASPGRLRTRSRDDGSYRLGPLSSRRVTLSLLTLEPDGSSQSRRGPTLELKPGDERRYDFDDPALGAVRYTCLPGQVGDLTLEALEGPPPRLQRMVFFGPGEGACPVLFGGLPPGLYRVEVSLHDRPDSPGSTQEVLVEAGRTTEVSLGE